MSKLLPNKEELTEIKRAIAENGMTNPKALAAAIGAFENSEFTLERVDSWCAYQQEKRPELFKADGGASDAVDPLHVQAFGPEPSLAAQGALVKKVGEAEAKKIAEKFGAKLGAIKPGTAVGQNDTNQNPWKLPASPESEKLIIDFISRRGTKLATDYARSAGKTINGAPLYKTA